MGAETLLLDIDRAADSLASSLREKGSKSQYCSIDVRETDSLGTALGSVLKGDGLDGLVYLVRGRERDSYLSLGPSSWDNDYSLTVKGAFFCARAAVPSLKAAASGLPSILFVSSILARVVGSESVSYHTAKAALEQLTRFLAVQLGPSGIRVNAVQPGFIVQDEHVGRYSSEANELYRERSETVHPLGRVGFSGDVIDPMLFLMSPMAKYMTGQTLCVDGGLTLQEQSHLVRDRFPAPIGNARERDPI